MYHKIYVINIKCNQITSQRWKSLHLAGPLTSDAWPSGPWHVPQLWSGPGLPLFPKLASSWPYELQSITHKINCVVCKQWLQIRTFPNKEISAVWCCLLNLYPIFHFRTFYSITRKSIKNSKKNNIFSKLVIYSMELAI